MQRHAQHNATLETIRRRFIQVSNEDDANYSKFVAVSRSGDLAVCKTLAATPADRPMLGCLLGGDSHHSYPYHHPSQ